jgi:hypothetical protein
VGITLGNTPWQGLTLAHWFQVKLIRDSVPHRLAYPDPGPVSPGFLTFYSQKLPGASKSWPPLSALALIWFLAAYCICGQEIMPPAAVLRRVSRFPFKKLLEGIESGQSAWEFQPMPKMWDSFTLSIFCYFLPCLRQISWAPKWWAPMHLGFCYTTIHTFWLPACIGGIWGAFFFLLSYSKAPVLHFLSHHHLIFQGSSERAIPFLA